MNRQQRRAAGRAAPAEPPTLESAMNAATVWRTRHDTLLDVLNMVLQAYGQGPELRLAVGREYAEAATRRALKMEQSPSGYVVYLDPVQQDVTPAPAKEDLDA